MDRNNPSPGAACIVAQILQTAQHDKSPHVHHARVRRLPPLRQEDDEAQASAAPLEKEPSRVKPTDRRRAVEDDRHHCGEGRPASLKHSLEKASVLYGGLAAARVPHSRRARGVVSQGVMPEVIAVPCVANGAAAGEAAGCTKSDEHACGSSSAPSAIAGEDAAVPDSHRGTGESLVQLMRGIFDYAVESAKSDGVPDNDGDSWVSADSYWDDNCDSEAIVSGSSAASLAISCRGAGSGGNARMASLTQTEMEECNSPVVVAPEPQHKIHAPLPLHRPAAPPPLRRPYAAAARESAGGRMPTLDDLLCQPRCGATIGGEVPARQGKMGPRAQLPRLQDHALRLPLTAR